MTIMKEGWRNCEDDNIIEPMIKMDILILTIAVIMTRMSGMEEDMDKVVAVVHEIRSACDGDGDGKISREEFVGNAKKSLFLFGMLSEALRNSEKCRTNSSALLTISLDQENISK